MEKFDLTRSATRLMVDDDRGVIWTDPDVRSSHQVPRHCFSILVLTQFRDPDGRDDLSLPDGAGSLDLLPIVG